ncbi:flagellin N-terminal helical domain-containing protein [Rhizobium sp. C4]|uniref:flagellin N-terminal helical domain-containing protein n=1 Tax=Rhizobium sp. C4 TaxID=1349800 RepID=UPI001E5F66D1|nr:flagellin [Rhizobium sp. C4]MCD2172706.1 flagellin [Rhizobium sp. C4]
MTSIMTNGAAMSALQTLRGISSQMDDTQSAISSGLRVSKASDNAAYWSIATTMRSDNKALSTVGDALGLAAAKTDTAYTGLNASISVVDQIKSKLVAAREPGVDKTKINSELTELKSQLTSISKSASFSGENWLYNTTGTAGTKEMVGSFTRDTTGNVSINTLKFNAANSVLIDTNAASGGQLTKALTVNQPIANSTGTTTATYFLIDAKSTTSAGGSEIKLTTGTNDQNIEGMISAVDTMLTNLTDSASKLGAVNSRISMQNDFVNNLQDVISKGVGRLVDADMNQESTKLKALQTQQQLGIQALSIANSDSQSVLSLFR